MNDKTKLPNIAASSDPARERRRELEALVPEAFSEGRLDLAALKRALGEEALIDSGERYRLDWAGKSDAYKVLQTPTTATLRPRRDKSVNFDQAQHVFIEGENLEVLKVLQKAYFSKVKLVYIDPPYNTGNDSFIYPDRFQESKEDYLKRINELADDGTLMREGFFRKNSRESGHFHSNWLSMMLPRLYIARNILQDNGLILVSVDDNESFNLRNLLNEIFGEENFIAQIVWRGGRRNAAKIISTSHEYMLLYAKNLNFCLKTGILWRERKRGLGEIYAEAKRLLEEHSDDYEKASLLLKEWYESLADDNPSKDHDHYCWVDSKGVYFASDISRGGGGGPKWKITNPHTGEIVSTPERGWAYSKLEDLESDIKNDLIHFNGSNVPCSKSYLKDNEMQLVDTVFYKDRRGSSKRLRRLLGGDFFDFPKDENVLQHFISVFTREQDMVVDFFGGAGATAHAVLNLNQSDVDSRRKFVFVQLPEKLDEESDAYKAGYRTIADIARARLKLVIDNLIRRSDLVSSQFSLGFKYYVLGPSTIKMWRGDGIDTPEELANQMKMFVNSEKKGTDAEDLLYELLLKFGQELTTPVERLEIQDVRIFAINGRQMLFVLKSFTESMIDPLLKLKPREVIALDSVFHDSDELKTNLDLQCRDAGVKFTCI